MIYLFPFVLFTCFFAFYLLIYLFNNLLIYSFFLNRHIAQIIGSILAVDKSNMYTMLKVCIAIITHQDNVIVFCCCYYYYYYYYYDIHIYHICFFL